MKDTCKISDGIDREKLQKIIHELFNDTGELFDYYTALNHLVFYLEHNHPYRLLQACEGIWKFLKDLDKSLDCYENFVNNRGDYRLCALYRVPANKRIWVTIAPGKKIKLRGLSGTEEGLLPLIESLELERLTWSKYRIKELLFKSFGEFAQYKTENIPEFGFPNPFAEAARGAFCDNTMLNSKEMLRHPELLIQKTNNKTKPKPKLNETLYTNQAFWEKVTGKRTEYDDSFIRSFNNNCKKWPFVRREHGKIFITDPKNNIPLIRAKFPQYVDSE